MARLEATLHSPSPRLGRRLLARALDWEDWLTLLLALLVVLSVTMTVEGSGVTRPMPALALVGLIALLAGMLLARSPLPMLLAWPLALLLGAAVTFWQALEAVPGEGLREQVETIARRFQTWFHIAREGGISNDPLPFVLLLVALTWLGVFLLAWGLFRWHNAWPGVIAGGVALFLNLAIVGGSAGQALFLFALLAALLLMRAHLMGQMKGWRREGVPYPPFISLSYLHLTAWAVLGLLLLAWALPVGAPPAAGLWEGVVERFQGVGVQFVRLAGPLRVKKIIPVHDYTSVLPFRGSVSLGERHILSVGIDDPDLSGPLLLRGAVYDEYSSGGWQASDRLELELPQEAQRLIRERLEEGSLQGRLIPLTVRVEARSVVGSVLFSPGEPVYANIPATIKVPSANLYFYRPYIPRGGLGLSDEEIINRWLPPNLIGLEVQRSEEGRVISIRVASLDDLPLPDAQVLQPPKRLAKGESYRVLGFLPDFSPQELQDRTDWDYPDWVRVRYRQLPSTLPRRVIDLARKIAGDEPSPYRRAKAIEDYLRAIPVDYALEDTPPGRDTVDYFLFQARRGYFDYHASAMVVMLRAVGIPARLAVGFVLDEDDRDPKTGLYRIRDRNAYAWPEVFFPGYGWLPFNPTPDRPADLRPGQRDRQEAELTPVDPSQISDLPVSANVPLLDVPPEAASTPSPRGGGSEPPVALWAGLLALAVIAGSIASATLGWRRSVAGLPYPQQVWEKTVRLASWAGLGPRPGQTPADFARSLARTLRSLPDLDLLAAAYSRSRFGRREPSDDERRRLALLWARLRGPLAWEVIRRWLLRRR